MSPITHPSLPRGPLTRFQKLALLTTAATYLLIVVGSLVRASGSGLGCPDWPKCFGGWVPPLRAEELPAGFDRALFNVTQTWIEYVNRLVGVAIGLLIFATLVTAIVDHRRELRIVGASAAAFVLVALEGWIGAKVVEHELRAWIVTVHMLLALVIVSLLLYATRTAFAPDALPTRDPERRRTLTAALVVLAVLFIQVGLGTLVRGSIDTAVGPYPTMPRSEWITVAGAFDLPHRQLAVVVFFATAYLVWRVRRVHALDRVLRASAWWAFAFASLQIIGGLVLAYGGLPAPMQVVHLGAASLLSGALTLTALVARQDSGATKR
jgi:cytochrome c oxidase assembly protein subunit 15